jgi:short-subunit dehydrogenase
MQVQGYGKIINLSLTFSRTVVPGRSVYAGIKAGINHLTEALENWNWCQTLNCELIIDNQAFIV